MNLFHRCIVRGFTLLYPVKIYGKENIPQGKAVFVCNHFRAIDCGYVAKLYGKDIKFLAKKELFNKKGLANIIKRFGAIPIDRDNPDMKTIIEVIRYLKEGHKVCIFPEGTRNKSGTNKLQETKEGYLLFALKSSSPIVPMVLNGKGRFLRRQKLIVGKPLYFNEYYGKKLEKEQLNDINKIVRENLMNLQENMSNIK